MEQNCAIVSLCVAMRTVVGAVEIPDVAPAVVTDDVDYGASVERTNEDLEPVASLITTTDTDRIAYLTRHLAVESYTVIYAANTHTYY